MEKTRFARVLVTLCFALTASFGAWAQHIDTGAVLKIMPLQGSGTIDEPYLIYDELDWETFTYMINEEGGDYLTAYYQQKDNITLGSANSPLTTVVGTKDKRFKGHYDGGGNTIELYMARDEMYAAPFGVVDGASFTNMMVMGFITTTNKFAGAIAAYTYGTVTVTNCISYVTISGTASYPDPKNNKKTLHDGTHGGFVGQCEDGSISFENCVFAGKIFDPATPKLTIKCAGFLGWVNKTVSYKNCLQIGEIDVADYMQTFHRCKNGAKASFDNAYYIQGFNDHQGEPALTQLPANEIVGVFKLPGEGNTELTYYIPAVEITGLGTSTYLETGDVITLSPTVTFMGMTLEEGKDYAMSIQKENASGEFEDVTEIKEDGNYKLVLAAASKRFAGTYEFAFEVVSPATAWTDLQNLLNKGGDVTLEDDYIAGSTDNALVVKKNTILDLNGHTINRNLGKATDGGYVIKINGNTSLTIEDNSATGSGVIKGGYNLNNGGGIYVSANGTLTLKGGSIAHNNSSKLGGGIYVDNNGTLTLKGGTITDNSSSTKGGGIFTKAKFYMEDGTISNNIATEGGGGIYAENPSTFEITGGTISGNKGVSKGGGIRINPGSNGATISGCTFSSNDVNKYGDSRGGAIHLDGNDANDKLTVTNCTFSGNTAGVTGADVFVLKGDATFEGCTFSEKNTVIIHTSNASINAILADNGDNTSTIAAMDGTTLKSVTLKNRVLYKDGDWNTICLPFDVDLNDVNCPLCGTGVEARTVNEATFENGELSLTFSDPVDLLIAGKPYIIQWTKDDNYVNNNTYNLFEPVFTNVKIDSSNHDVVFTGGNGRFKGSYDYQAFTATDYSVLLMGLNNRLYSPAAGSSLGAFRAFFQLDDPDNNKVKALSMNFDGGEDPDGITLIDNEQLTIDNDAWYTIDGHRLSGKPVQKGVYVNNGKKVAVK